MQLCNLECFHCFLYIQCGDVKTWSVYWKKNTHNRHPIACLQEWAMGCPLWDVKIDLCSVLVTGLLYWQCYNAASVYEMSGDINIYSTQQECFNTLRPRQDGCHFPDDIFKWIFLNEKIWVPIEISLKFVPQGPTNNIPALVQIMAWHRPGDKPLSEPMMVRLPTHICVTRPQWVNI